MVRADDVAPIRILVYGTGAFIGGRFFNKANIPFGEGDSITTKETRNIYGGGSMANFAAGAAFTIFTIAYFDVYRWLLNG
mgnify:CR=1 FL=1|tara:strand:- start:506 stop:745 length:240 start_codon:yes stop_codon:yes gene_type:complete